MFHRIWHSISSIFWGIIHWFDGVINGEVMTIKCQHCSFAVHPKDETLEEDLLEALEKHYCFSNPDVREFTLWSRRFFIYWTSYTLRKP